MKWWVAVGFELIQVRVDIFRYLSVMLWTTLYSPFITYIRLHNLNQDIYIFYKDFVQVLFYLFPLFLLLPTLLISTHFQNIFGVHLSIIKEVHGERINFFSLEYWLICISYYKYDYVHNCKSAGLFYGACNWDTLFFIICLFSK